MVPVEDDEQPITSPPAHSEQIEPTSTPAKRSEPSPAEEFPVVGIGASAGGLDAFSAFLRAMPNDSGIAFVLIQHLDPNHESMMANLLSRHTDMPVREAEDAMLLEPNTVYMIPPKKYLKLVDGGLFLDEPVKRRGMRMPIDYFFQSLAEARQERAICIVLSGTGSDGTLGLKEVKGAGGMAMVQQPDTAAYDGMPRSAVSTGVVDFVMAIDEMPNALLSYVRHPYIKEEREKQRPSEVEPDQFRSILKLLYAHTDYDFSAYKKSTLDRRIQRRMGLNHFNNLGDYLKYLRSNSREVRLLFKDLLIGVTRFFREPESWAALDTKVIQPIIHSKKKNEPIRIWVPGCSSGEEAYSLAMLFQDNIDRLGLNNVIHIFATDLDEDSVAIGRYGFYPGNIISDVSPEYLRKYFFEEAEGYRVSKRLRESVVFAVQNLIGDPPFSKLDLISCRNVMIYLETEVQQKLMNLFHFALRENGFLFMGSAESSSRLGKLFEPVSESDRIYRRKNSPAPARANLPLGTRAEPSRAQPKLQGHIERSQSQSSVETAKRLLLERFAPASVLIDTRHEVIYFHGPLRQYLDVPAGEPTSNILNLSLEGLRNKLKRLLINSAQTGETGEDVAKRVKRNGDYVDVRLRVEPVTLHQRDPLYLVSFVDDDPPRTSPKVPAEPRSERQNDGPSTSDDVVAQLEYELRATREDLQSTIQDFETSNEELKASNEEVMSMNEELQSTNEELETGREELQSLNEELNTINSQLEEKIDEVERANDDLSNLLASTDIATIFLDTNLRIRRFTPVVSELFNVIQSDIGRPVSDLAPRVNDARLLEDAMGVLKELTASETEVKSGDGRWFLRQIRPYRTSENRIEGVVVTFTNISILKAAAAKLEKRERQQAALADLGRFALSTTDREALFRKALAMVMQTFECDMAKVLEYQADRDVFVLRAEQGFSQAQVNETVVSAGTASQAGHTLRVASPVIVNNFDNETRFSGPPLLRDHGVVSGMSVLIGTKEEPYGVLGAHNKSPRDFSVDDINGLQAIANVLFEAIRRSENLALLADQEARLRLAFEAAKLGSWEWYPSTDEVIWDRRLMRLFGVNESNKPTSSSEVLTFMGEHDRANARDRLKQLFTQGTHYEHEYRIVDEQGQERWLMGRGDAVRNPDGTVDRIVGVTFDITEQKRTQIALLESEQRFELAMSAINGMVYDWDRRTDQVFRSEGMERLIGVASKDAESTGDWWWKRIHPDDFAAVERQVSTAFAKMEPTIMTEYRVMSADGNYVDVVDQAVIIYDTTTGEPVRLIGSSYDISERKAFERRQSLMMAELDHRVKNILANVVAIAKQSRRRASSVDHFIEALDGRIQAMATAHSLVSENSWEGASLKSLLKAELLPYGYADSGRVRISGSDVILKPRAAQSLALAFHELATNAAKYGSLASDTGSIDICWRRHEGDQGGVIRLVWQEHGIADVAPPDEEGFGLSVLRMMIKTDLKADVSVQFPEQGLLCEMNLPAARVVAEASLAGTQRAHDLAEARATALKKTPRGSGKTILIVEDNWPVATDMKQSLETRQFNVAGPASTVADALALIDEKIIDAAIVDVQLADELVTPVAERLNKDGTPYVILTGYADPNIVPTCMRDRPRLLKPTDTDMIMSALSDIL